MLIFVFQTLFQFPVSSQNQIRYIDKAGVIFVSDGANSVSTS